MGETWGSAALASEARNRSERRCEAECCGEIEAFPHEQRDTNTATPYIGIAIPIRQHLTLGARYQYGNTLHWERDTDTAIPYIG